jgi:UDP-galactopyranose mutase
MTFEYVIIGAGYAGSVLAERIASQLDKKVLLIEKRNHIGGNCYDLKDDNNILIHKYGPHIFHTDNKNVWDYLSLFTQWDNYHHEVLAMVDGKKVPIPFNLNTLHQVFPASLANKIEAKLLEKYAYNSKVPILELKKADDPDLKMLAEFIYEKVFAHYTAKQWGMKPEEIDPSVTARVPVFIGRDNRYFNDKYQAIPKAGFTKMFEKMLDHPNIKLMLNTDFKEVCTLENDKFLLFGQEFGGKVIYTGCVDELFDYEFGPLAYRTINMAFETVDTEKYQEAATVNYPSNYDYLRITEFKYIHPCNSPRTTILKEYPAEYKPGRNIPYYPVFTDECRSGYTKYLARAEKVPGLILVGRLAEYKYYDMDDMVARALEMFDTRIANDRASV